jgi:purine-binding chemotaxis protein CheW
MAASQMVGDGSAGCLVVFSLDDQRYALPLARVHRSLRVVAITPLPEAPPLVLGVVDLAGDVVPVIDVRKRLGHPHRPVRLSDHLLLADTGRRRVALLVDEARGVIDLGPDDVAPAGEIVPGLDLIGAVVKLADGLVLIHDLGRLLSLDDEAALDRALASEEAPA